jgi:hypothetical protein
LRAEARCWITYVHRQRHAHNDSIEVEKRLVLGKATRDQFGSDQVEEISIESAVDEEIEHLFKPIPYVVDVDKGFRNLQAGWNPNTVH